MADRGGVEELPGVWRDRARQMLADLETIAPDEEERIAAYHGMVGVLSGCANELQIALAELTTLRARAGAAEADLLKALQELEASCKGVAACRSLVGKWRSDAEYLGNVGDDQEQSPEIRYWNQGCAEALLGAADYLDTALQAIASRGESGGGDA